MAYLSKDGIGSDHDVLHRSLE